MTNDIQLLELEQDCDEDREQEISSIAGERAIAPSEAAQLIEERNRIAVEKCWEDAIIYFDSMLAGWPIQC